MSGIELWTRNNKKNLWKSEKSNENVDNTPGTAVCPGDRDRTLAVKSRKSAEKSVFCIYLLVMPKYWGKQIFSLGSFPEVGQKQKTEKKEERKKKD